MKFYLIQRADFWNDAPVEEITGFAGGRSNLLGLDYMGSAEFEFGAIPKAFRRIMGEFEEYQIFDTPIVNSNGVPLHLFCKSSMRDEIIESLQDYINKPYQMKENPRFPYCIFSNRHPRAWWDIENDFIMFFGVHDRTEKFGTIINREYKEWWMAKTEEERKNDLQKAYNGY